jgi:hypothetical protein
MTGKALVCNAHPTERRFEGVLKDVLQHSGYAVTRPSVRSDVTGLCFLQGYYFA